MEPRSVLLIDPEDQARDVLIERLRMQGYKATGFAGPIEGANVALSSPPAIVIADLWMSGISGVQLTRLLRSEPATERVPIILRGPDSPRNRFWSERAGAAAYVVKGRMGDLVRAIERSILRDVAEEDGFFTQLQDSESAIRDRIAAYLDAALFESVLAAEVRALSTCGAFDRLFDLLTQFVSQVMSYRWLALMVLRPPHMGIHTHPSSREQSESEAREVLQASGPLRLLHIEDEDATAEPAGRPALVCPVTFGKEVLAKIALSPKVAEDRQDARILDVVARELGGPLRMALLVEEAQLAATTDPLTGNMNRRALLAALDIEQSRAFRHGYPLSLLMLDVDHFKSINDVHGHATGDQVLSALGKLLSTQARKTDIVARWGGEEFVIVLAGASESGARIAGERIRHCVELLHLANDKGEVVNVTISVGISCMEINDSAAILIDRADRAMYQAKAAGRNCVIVAPSIVRRTGSELQIPSEMQVPPDAESNGME
jgi:two-component system cell cycle response regulator